MSTKSEVKGEVKEIEVLTEEQISVLPDSVRDNVIFLTEEMNPKDLMVLNPAVQTLLKLRERGAKLKMKAPVDGKFDKENIQSFVDLKKDIRSFRSGIKETAKKLKEPYAKITKGIISIEKTFVEEGTVVYDVAEKEFDPYIKAEAEKDRIKQEKKDKALNDAILKAEQENKAIILEAEKTKTYNKIKYEIIAEKITEATSDALLNSNESKLKGLKEDFGGVTFDEIVSNFRIDVSSLDLEILTELKESLIKAQRNSIALINDKLESIAIERKNLILESAKEESKKEIPINPTPVSNTTPITPPVPPIPNVPQVPNTITRNSETLTDQELIDYVKKEGLRIFNIVNGRIGNNGACNPEIYKLRSELSYFQ